MRLALLLATCVLVLPSHGQVEGRWGGQGTFPGWPSIFCVLELDGEESTLTTLPAQLMDQPIGAWSSSGESFSFEVDVHGTMFTVDGTSTGASITGSIQKKGEEGTGSLDLVSYPEVSSMPGRKRWSSALQAGAMEIPMILDTATGADGRLHADLSIPSQQLVAFPLEVVPSDDGLVRMTLHAGAGPAIFETKLSDEKMTVNFEQGGFQQDLVFTADVDATTTYNRPQEPKPPFPYASREVQLSHPDGHTIAGTLTIPAGPGPHPAVVLITGSGLQDRNEEIMGHKPFLVLADHLTRKGIAVLRADDRGAGDSFVPDRSTLLDLTTLDFASDTSLQVDYLLTQADIDREHIGLIGHSEGAIVAPIVADQRTDIAFVVLLAGPCRPGIEMLADQNRRLMEVEGVDAETIEEVVEQFIFVMGMVKDRASAEELAEPMRRLSILQTETMGLDIEVDDAFVADAVKQAQLPWLQWYLSHDGSTVLSRLDMPILAINGSLDVQVLSEHELPAIKRAAAGNPDVTTREYEGLNHLFQPAETGSISEYERIEITIEPRVLEDMSSWINERSRNDE